MSRASWRSLPLVISACAVLAFLVLGMLGIAADSTVEPAGRVVAGVVAGALTAVAARVGRAGLVLEPGRVTVRGALTGRRVATADVTAVVLETLGPLWCRAAIVRADGVVTPAWWTLWFRRGTRLPVVTRELAAFAAASGVRTEGTAELPPPGRALVTTMHLEGVAFAAPPGWPTPPPGWRPPSGWQPDPAWPPPPDGWDFWPRLAVGVIGGESSASRPGEAAPASVPDRLDDRFPLDREIAADLVRGHWGFGEVAKSLVWFGVLLGVLIGVDVLVDIPSAIGGFLSEGAIGIAAALGAGKAFRSSGNARAAVGWSLPHLRDIRVALRWTGWQFIAGVVTSIVLLVLVPRARHENVSNTEDLHHHAIGGLIVVIAAAVLLAPVVEELFFRGVLLRATMRRFSFWPSAVLTSTLFGLAHAPQVDTGAARIVLTVSIGVFGVLQCMLVRRSGRLGPAMIVHGIRNAIAVAITLA